MNTVIKRMLAVLMSGCCTLAAYAVDTSITVNGKVIASACQTGVGAVYNIDLGQNHKESDLASAGSATGYVAQDVVLSNCPGGTNTIKAAFSGTADSLNPTMYANKNGTGYATGVAVQLQNAIASTDVGNLATMSVNKNVSNQAIFPLRARLYSKNGGAKTGAVEVSVIMNLTYN
ncbi:fimbrial protein [Erwinia sp. B116]|uniref:fimbrial protein n=1 Tax=Erwinia sp. B116 TaxID=1561024 RepID=UPI000C758746|nr:fimbrial protein [Erwinia sp. B116]